MAYKLETFISDDLRHLRISKNQPVSRAVTVWPDEYTGRLQASGPCFTGFDKRRVIFVCGFYIHWPGRSTAWAMLSEDVGYSEMLWIHRTAKVLVERHQLQCRRIEGYVKEDFTAGHHWMKMLGFESEGVMRSYDPLGFDTRLYARIR